MTKISSTIITFFAAIAGCVMLTTGCTPGAQYRQIDGSVWATTYHIVYRAPRSLDDSIIAVMKQVEMSLSPFVDESLVSRINRGETDRVDSLFIRVFEGSQAVNRLSGGAFDPTVAPLINLWGFGWKGRDAKPPTDAAIDSALRSVGIADCRVANLVLAKKSADTQFNFSAITKGMGVDMVAEMLRRNGVNDYMVEIGGEIALNGVNDRGNAWRIMVDAPIDNDTTVTHSRMAVIALSKGAVATSGNYRNYRDTEQGRVAHTISPVTGRPVTTSTLSVTVLAPECMMADALATACMAMQPDSALAMIARIPDAEALIVSAGRGGAYKFSISPGFPTMEK